MIELRANISGKVQGVRYRDYAQESATKLDLVGFVQNKSDGSVLVVAQGMPDTLKEFVEYLHEGSVQAEVAGVAVEWGSINKVYYEFSILY